MSHWALSIQLKISDILVGTSNGTDHFGLVRPEYSGPALKVVHCDRSGHFGRSDRNVPFHLPKLLSPVPLFCILLTTTITKRAVDWVGSVQPECTVPLGTWNFRNFRWEFFLNGKHAIFRISRFGRFSDKPLRLTLITNINIYPQLLLSVLTPDNYA